MTFYFHTPTTTTEASSSIDVLDYEVYPNDSTRDSGPGFAAAWVAFKAQLSATTGFVDTTLFIPPGDYYCATSINWTGGASTFLGWNSEIYARGAVIRSTVSGKPAVDMTGVRGVEIDGLSIWGDSASKPSCGLLVGPRATDTCGNNYFRRMKIRGQYTKAAVVNHGSETTVWDNCYFVNANTDAATYCFIADGSNKFGLTSDYATMRSANTAVSFTNNSFSGNCRFEKNTAGSALYLEYTTGFDFDRSNYFQNFANSNVVLYQSSASRNSGLKLRGLFETDLSTGVDYTVTIVTPDGESSAIEGFELDCHIPHASVAIIRQVRESDYGNMTSGGMSIRNGNIEINGYTGGSPVPLFAGDKLSFIGSIRATSGAQVNLDQLTRFDGIVWTDNASPVGVPAGTSTAIIIDRTTGSATHFGLFNMAGDFVAARADRKMRRSTVAFATGQTIVWGDARYVSAADRNYRCVNAGGTTTSTAPSHTSGTAPVDGIAWLALDTGTSIALVELSNLGVMVETPLKLLNISDGTSSECIVASGNGSPESVITAPPGSLYTRRDGGSGTCLYVKESGTAATGWVAK